MTSINFTIKEALSWYLTMMGDGVAFTCFAIVSLIFTALITLNADNKNANFLVIGLHALIIGIICWFNGRNIVNNLDLLFKGNLFKNIYLYLVNMIVSLILIAHIYTSKNIPKGFKYVVLTLYFFLLLNLLFSIYMSNYLQNVMLLLLVNIYPMVLVGNILAFILYALYIIYILFYSKKKKKHRLGNHL